MINKQSSNDEVLHHLKQMELMLLSDEEEKGLKKILNLEDILGCPKVEYWIDDGVFTNTWLSGTKDLLKEVKSKLLKNHVIKEHLSQCRGFVAYNILLNKLENSNMVLMYQNGEWVFAFLNERKEQESWVNQRFNSCFFNTTYERKFLALIKEMPSIDVDRAWLFKRENWFYSSDLFEELNVVFNKMKFEDIDKEKDISTDVLEDIMPPLDEDVQESVSILSSVSTQESVQVEVQEIIENAVNAANIEESALLSSSAEEVFIEQQVQVAEPLKVVKPITVVSKNIKSAEIPFGDDVPFDDSSDTPFVADEDLPPLDDAGEFDLFKPIDAPSAEVSGAKDVFVDTQEEPIKVDFGFEENESIFTPVDVPVAVEGVVKSNEHNVAVAPVLSNKGVSISPIPEKKVQAAPVQEKPATDAPSKPRVVFGSKRPSALVSEASTAPSAPAEIKEKKGFSLSLGGKKVSPVISNDIPFDDDGSVDNEE